MKINSYLLAPLCAAMAIFMLGSCSDEQIVEGNGGRPTGNGIVFGASTGYAGAPGSKTAYGDVSADGSSQEILWVIGDRVDVYSPSSPSMTKAEYEIGGIGLDTGDDGQGYLAAIDGRNGLQWDKGSTTQDFYAVYPSKASMTNQTIANEYVSFENGVLRGFIPVNQQHTIYKGTNGWVAEPNMDWQYMVAETEDFEVPQDGTDGGVNLNFKPIVTTLEITLVGGQEAFDLSQMNIEAPEGAVIMGQFECDLVNGNVDEDGMPVCRFLQSGTTTDFVTVSLYDKDNAPIRLQPGEEITFNVFLLPVENLTNLSIRIAGFNTGSKTLALAQQGGTSITLEKHKKTRVRISTPDLASEPNQWISGIEDDVLVSQLSIPGTANSFSYRLSNNNHKTQTADIDTQWNAGIRCFELVGGSSDDSNNLEDAPLLCNREEIGMTFGDAVEAIWNKVQNTDEFAMIIPFYDSNAGHGGTGDGVRDYATDLNGFYETHTNYKYVTYGAGLTVGDARGGLIFIARITSEEDANITFGITPSQGVFVDQWGSLKDNWARRGYTLGDGTVVNNWAQGNDDTNSMEYYMFQTYKDRNETPVMNAPANLPTRVDDNVNFIHATTRAGGSTGNAYIQDWQRVVPRDGVVSDLRSGGFLLGRQPSRWVVDGFLSGYREYTHNYVYWPESLTEKENDIWNTYMLSIGVDDHSGQFFINSLDGYFVDPDIELSYKPYVQDGNWNDVGLGNGGTDGNIRAYANYINNYFYNRVLDYGVGNIYGPMNIILMDYVYDGTEGGQRLPSTVINNNFRFPLLTAGETESFGDGGTSMGNGGSAIE